LFSDYKNFCTKDDECASDFLCCNEQKKYCTIFFECAETCKSDWELGTQFDNCCGYFEISLTGLLATVASLIPGVDDAAY
jgi:hypothetical protein